MRKVLVVIVILVAVLVWVPGLREKVWSGVSNTVGEWTKPDAGPVKGVNIVKVYVVRNGPYYHTKDCPEIAGKTVVSTNLAEARELYKPCPVCKPPQ